MAWLNPTDETDACTAPDGRIYLDRERCRKFLVGKTRYRLFSCLAVFGIMLLLCPLSVLAFFTAMQTSNLFVRGLWIFFGSPPIFYAVVTLTLVVKWSVRFFQARKGIFLVETDEVASVAYREKYSKVVNGVLIIWRHRNFLLTYVRFRKNGKIVLDGDIPIDVINTRDTFYIVRAGKSTRSRRVDLCFDTRQYVWKD